MHYSTYLASLNSIISVKKVHPINSENKSNYEPIHLTRKKRIYDHTTTTNHQSRRERTKYICYTRLGFSKRVS